MMRLKNKQALQRYLMQYSQRIEEALVTELEYMVADLENHAKAHGDYDDQTSNLRSSIGGVVLKDGKPITYKGFEGKQEGVGTGIEFINSLMAGYKSGYVILMVAGMEYGAYVEDMENYNVLKKTELEMQRQLPKIMSKLKSKIDNNPL